MKTLLNDPMWRLERPPDITKIVQNLSAFANINYGLSSKCIDHICTVRHIRIEIIHGSDNVL